MYDGDAAPEPIRQIFALSHESPRDATEVAQRPRAPVLPRLQRHRFI